MTKQHSAMGERIKAARKEKRLTQQEMADALNVSVQSVSQWETGRTKPEYDRLKAIAKLLDKDRELLSLGVSKSIDGKSGSRRQSDLGHVHRRMAIIVTLEHFQEGGSLPFLLPDEIDDTVLVARDAAIGELYAVELAVEDMEPMFRVGDYAIIDTAVPVRVGDFVVARVGDDEIVFRQVRAIRLDEDERSVLELHAFKDETPPVTMVLGDHFDRVIGTMTEFRRFRRK